MSNAVLIKPILIVSKNEKKKNAVLKEENLAPD